ncbi:MAG TPA: trigger factor [Chloroflexota bacterium]|nr:trigger factor [Chloroflexota bacterium]
MKVTTEKPEPGVAALTVEVPAEEFDRAVDQAWRRVAGRVNIPGFRRGKAPRPLVERHVGPAAINEEALRRLLPQRYDAAVEETGLHPIERPAFDIVQLEAGKPLVFKATVAVQPTVELGDYNELRVEPEKVEVGQEDVDRVLNRLREGQAQWIPVEDRGLEMGDQAIADLTVTFPPEEERPERQTERKDSEVILGENGYPEGFDRELLGARPGETRTFSLTWGTPPSPATAEAEGGAEAEATDESATAEAEGGAAAEAGEGAETPPAGGPTTSFAITVKDVKRKQLPELDDDFAKSLGDHDTLAALTDTVRARLAEEALRSARVATENRVVDAAVEQASYEIPERLVEAETDALGQERSQSLSGQGLTVERYLSLVGRTPEDWRAEQRQQAERQIKARVMLDAVAEREGLSVSPDEVEDEIERTAQSYGQQADEVRRALMTQDSRRRIASSLRRHKAIERLVEIAGGYPTVPALAEPAEAAEAAEARPQAPEAPPPVASAAVDAAGEPRADSAEAPPAEGAPESPGSEGSETTPAPEAPRASAAPRPGATPETSDKAE